MSIRKARVAGQFYPADKVELNKQLGKLVSSEKKEDALGLIVPHAGYIYSGSVAGAGFSKVKITKTCIIIGPNHLCLGNPFSIITQGQWQLPLGTIEIDQILSAGILKQSEDLKDDTRAHSQEHSIEVQLPFLQFLSGDVKIVPIVLQAGPLKTYQRLGRAIAKALQESKQHCLIVASSDLSHYEPEDRAKKNDNLAIQAILNLDEQELEQQIRRSNITMCGFGPVACMLACVKQLGAKQAKLVKYQTSGDVTGDRSSVVGYASIIVS